MNVRNNLQAIVAMTDDRVIGKDGAIPWHLPEDFKWFKRKTMGGALLMGRKTFDSIGRPLPGRRNIVLTRNCDFRAEGIDVVHSIEALDQADIQGDIYLIGGGILYVELLPRCSDLFISHVHRQYCGDTYFPEFKDQFTMQEIVLEKAEFTVRHWVRG